MSRKPVKNSNKYLFMSRWSVGDRRTLCGDPGRDTHASTYLTYYMYLPLIYRMLETCYQRSIQWSVHKIIMRQNNPCHQEGANLIIVIPITLWHNYYILYVACDFVSGLKATHHHHKSLFRSFHYILEIVRLANYNYVQFVGLCENGRTSSL